MSRRSAKRADVLRALVAADVSFNWEGTPMVVLIRRGWRVEEIRQEVGPSRDFRRADSHFCNRFAADSSSGFTSAVRDQFLVVESRYA
jgi:hypothetical protein